MPGFIVASALVSAVCEEAIRSSYLYYFSDRGARRLTVISIGAVFVVGEVVYDIPLFPGAIKQYGFSAALPLFITAIITGVFLHVALTFWTACKQAMGTAPFRIFVMALMFHAAFNLVAILAMESLL